jgi:trigger factor
MTLKAEVEKLEGNKVLIKVEVSTDKFDEAIKDAYKEIGTKVKIPGFRKGKIPPEIIKTRLGDEVVVNEALDKGLINYYMEAVNFTDIQPIDKPDFNVIQSEIGKSLVFEVKVDVKPEVKLGEYKNLDIKIDPIVISEEEIDKEVENLSNKFAKLEVSQDDAKLKEGDFALIDFKGYLNEEPFEGGSASDYLLEIGSKSFIPGFEDQLIGTAKGEERQVNVIFPADYGAVNLAGKETKFDVHIKEIKHKVFPEINDDFAKEIGGFDTIEELRKEIEAKIKKEKNLKTENELRVKILSAITANSEVEIPEIMITNRSNETISNFTDTLSAQGSRIEDYLSHINKDFNAFIEDINKDSERNIKTELVLEAIGKTEEFAVTEDEVNDLMVFYAEKSNQKTEDLKAFILKKGDMPFLRSEVLIRKTLDWFVGNKKTELGIEEIKEQEKQESPDTSAMPDLFGIMEAIEGIKKGETTETETKNEEEQE